MKFFVLKFCFLVHAATFDSAQAVEGMNRFRATLQSADKPALMIGRGNKDGMSDGSINPRLRGLKWLFIDPDSYANHSDISRQDESQTNAIKAPWPLDLGVENFFEVVAIDHYVLSYIGAFEDLTRSGHDFEETVHRVWKLDVENALIKAYQVLKYGGVLFVGNSMLFARIYGGEHYDETLHKYVPEEDIVRENMAEALANILGISKDSVTPHFEPGEIDQYPNLTHQITDPIFPKDPTVDDTNNQNKWTWFEIHKILPDLNKLEEEQVGLDWAVAHKLNGGYDDSVKLESLRWHAAHGRNRLSRAMKEILDYKLVRFKELMRLKNDNPNEHTVWALEDYLATDLMPFLKDKYIALLNSTKQNLSDIASKRPSDEHAQFALDDHVNKVAMFKDKMADLGIVLQ